jgi:predicted dinucleotide-binding enzyme
MRIGILGSGSVAQTLGAKLVQIGHEVKLGSRTVTNEKAAAWAGAHGARASHGTFEDAAKFGQVLLNCTAGVASLDALDAAGAANLRDKILMDVANPLDFSKGMPPRLTVCNTDSLGEQIQRAFPDVKVVKTLNTMNCEVMVNPGLVPGPHDIFVCGDDAGARNTVAGYLRAWFGWTSVVDLGDITAARGTEMLLPAWIRLMQVLGTAKFNWRIQHG